MGGQTRMPIIQERLTKFFGKAPIQGRAPGRGGGHRRGALRALARGRHQPPASSCWTSSPWPSAWRRRAASFHVVFPRNAAIPNAKQILATTSFDSQTELAMRIYQGDNEAAKKNELLGRVRLLGHQRRQGRRRAGGGHLRRERRGHPHHERAGSGHRAEDEDHGPGDAELIGGKHGLGGQPGTRPSRGACRGSPRLGPALHVVRSRDAAAHLRSGQSLMSSIVSSRIAPGPRAPELAARTREAR